MSIKKNTGLGRSYLSILDDNMIPDGHSVTSLRISQIEPRKEQPRKYFSNESLSSLADSIAAHGVLQPLLVRDVGEGYYQIIAGERRWRAAKLAGLTEVPVIVLDSDELMTAQISLVENIQREDLNPVEEAMAFRTLVTQFSLTQEELSAQVGRSRSAIANALRLLDLPEATLGLLSSGQLSSGHARALLGLKDKEQIDPLALRIVAKDMSVRSTEDAVKKLNSQPEAEEQKPPIVDYFKELENKAMSAMGRRVRISHKGRVKTVSFSYEDDDDLQAILEKLCGENTFKE